MHDVHCHQHNSIVAGLTPAIRLHVTSKSKKRFSGKVMVEFSK